MKYKYIKENCDSFGDYYFEIDEEGTAYRQIIANDGTIIVSNRPFQQLHFCLADQEIMFNPETEIDKEEFEELWQSGNKPFINDWKYATERVCLGQEVQGEIEVLYSQGIIINLGNNSYGIVDYNECLNNSGSHMIYPGNVIRGNVKGFDYLNLWVIIDKPSILGNSSEK